MNTPILTARPGQRYSVGILALIISLFGAMSAHAATYYISKSAGSDSNTGTSKSTPWGHLPGMPSCTGACASANPQPGDHFILRGGDTWSSSDLGIAWQWQGTSNNRIYVGVDQTWFNSSACGASWCRPIFTCGGAACSANSNMFINVWTNGNYTTFDNIEMTGLSNDGGNAFVYVTAPNIEVEHMYLHGWVLGGSSNNSGAIKGVGAVTGSSAHDNVIDGSDTAQNTMNGIYGEMPLIYNNVIRYTVAGILGDANIIHDNLVEDMIQSATGDHCNLVYQFIPYSGSTLLAYNNVVRNNVNCSGGMAFWLNGSTGSNGCPGCVAYAFNNIVYNAQQGITTGGHPGSTDYGTFHVYNNIIEPGGGDCMGNGETPPHMTVNYGNNHCITGGNLCGSAGATCTDQGGNLKQTLAQANSAGYNASQTYAYSPTSSSNPTVGTGVNRQSLCTTISAIDASAGATCQNDTAYAVGYNTSNHTVVVPGRSPIARPGGAWDAGAYQYNGAGAPLTIQTSSLPGGTVGTAYNQTLTASGGTSPYAWTITSGALPAGLNVAGATGIISGMPTTGGTANFTVQVKDSASATKTQALSIVITAPDTTPPSVPTGLSASAVSSSEIDLSWTASTDPDSPVAGYQVWRGGVFVSSVTSGTSYQDSGRTPLTTYTYAVAAYDATPNVSAKSPSVSATTLSGPPPGSITYIQSTAQDCGTVASCSLAWPSANQAGDLLVLALRAGAGGNTITVSDSRGNVYQPVATQVDSADGQESYLYDAPNAIAGSNTTTVSVSGPANTIRLALLEYSGVAASNALDTQSTAQGGNGSTVIQTGTLSPSSGNELVIALGTTGSNNNTFTAASGYTLRATTNKLGTEDQVISSAGSLSPTFTIAQADNYAGVSAAFKGSKITPPAPVITSPTTAAGQVGTAFNYSITATNKPSRYNATGLPSGLSANTASGLISGTPTAAGTSGISLSATNSAGTGNAVLTLTISSAPDTTPPTVPAGPAAVAISSTQINLSWAPSTDPVVPGHITSGVIGYGVYRNSVFVSSVTSGTVYQDSGRSALTSYSYDVTAYDVAGNVSGASVVVTTTTLPAPPPPTLLIDAGSTSSYLGYSGMTWSADTGSLGGTSVQTTAKIPNTYNGGLYQTARVNTGTLEYQFTVPNGNYNVVLKFAEIVYTAAGQRVFNIVINGQTMTPTPFDIYVQAGNMANKAIDKTYPVTVTGGLVDIRLTPVTGSPMVNALAVAPSSKALATIASEGAITASASDLMAVRVYPNPWRSDKHAGYDITFDQMPSGSTVKIFDMAGHWVKTLEAPSGLVTWNRTNDSGDPVGSGVYIYLVTDNQGNKAHGKFSVIR